MTRIPFWSGPQPPVRAAPRSRRLSRYRPRPADRVRGPTGAPGPGAISLGLNRSLVSLDNKLNQFDAAVTVQRAVRQALTRICKGSGPMLAHRFEMTGPTAWTVRLARRSPLLRRNPGHRQGRPTALRIYAGVNGSFIVGLLTCLLSSRSTSAPSACTPSARCPSSTS
ncbi:Peptide ABC transporter substrate-binding protein OS=Streptomyces antimycoticus OX=68175 GN=SSPO_017930 PE=3 SV=1 [Streptomyces antimycoticus]